MLGVCPYIVFGDISEDSSCIFRILGYPHRRRKWKIKALENTSCVLNVTENT